MKKAKNQLFQRAQEKKLQLLRIFWLTLASGWKLIKKRRMLTCPL